MLNCECWYGLMRVFKLRTILELPAVGNNESNTLWHFTTFMKIQHLFY